MNRKDIAISFLQDAATGKVDAAYSKVAPNFRHHNPYFPGDAESLKAGMAQAAAMFPNTTLVVKHVLEDEAVTVRDRDTWEQERVKVADLPTYLLQRMAPEPTTQM